MHNIDVCGYEWHDENGLHWCGCYNLPHENHICMTCGDLHA